jgi:filamentous hemagglutinin family protein
MVMAACGRQGYAQVSARLGAAALLLAGPVLANPTAPAVVSGNATFTSAGNLLQVANSPNAVINWQSFSIGAGQTLQFIQPSAGSAVLNRVVTGNPSSILGTLSSNGRVFLLNPNGVVFGPGAQVNTASFTVSTGQLADNAFLAGGAPSGGSTVTVAGPFSVGGSLDVSATGVNLAGALNTTADITITSPNPLGGTPPFPEIGGSLTAEFRNVSVVQLSFGIVSPDLWSGSLSPGSTANLVQGVAAFSASHGIGSGGAVLAAGGGTLTLTAAGVNPGAGISVRASGSLAATAAGVTVASPGQSTGSTRNNPTAAATSAVIATPPAVPAAAAAGAARVVLQKREPMY